MQSKVPSSSRLPQSSRSTRTERWLLLAALLAPAALAFPADAFAQGVGVEEASDAQKQEAGDKYAEGTRYFTAGQFDQAYRSFKASYGVVASPNSHLMMARALAEMGKTAEAYNELAVVEKRARQAAASDPKYQATAEKAAELQNELAPKVARVRFNVIGGDDGGGAGAVSVDGVEVPREHWSAARAYEPGSHSIEGSFAGAVRRTITVQMLAGDEQTVDVDVREQGAAGPVPVSPHHPAQPGDSSDPGTDDSTGSGGGVLMPLATAAAGVGVAGFVMFAIAGSMNQSTFDDVESRCTSDNRCPPEVQDDIDKGETLQTVANVGLIIGAVGIVTGVTLFSIDLATDDGGSDDDDVASAGSVNLGATVTPLGSWATASGTF